MKFRFAAGLFWMSVPFVAFGTEPSLGSEAAILNRQARGPWSLDIESGVTWNTFNRVGLPGDTGTRFAFSQLLGRGAVPFARYSLVHESDQGSGWRLLIAPLQITRTGSLRQATSFQGTTFAAGPTTGKYQFNSYRLTYRNRWKKGPNSDWRIGFTAKIRDAEIRLSQAGTTARKTDLGVVPLLHVFGEERLAGRWGYTFELDGAAAPQGRAIDASLRLNYDLSPQTRLFAGYRVLDGGADNPEVYNFTTFQYVTVGVHVRF